MKRMVLWVLCLLAVLLPVCAGAEVYGTLRSDVQVSTGPGEQYALIPQMELEKGERVTVRTQFTSGGETWLQVEFSFAGARARGYVRSAEVNAALKGVPKEAPLCTGKLIRTEGAAVTGPLHQGYLGYNCDLRQGSSVVVFEVEDGSALIECWNYDLVRKCRLWVALDDLETEMVFGDGYYGVAEEESLLIPAPTKAPSTYYGSVEKGYPVGMMCTVVSGSCHVKEEPGAEYQTINYAYVGERYEVLECRSGSTGKDWYRIKIGGAYGWISSGLVSLD